MMHMDGAHAAAHLHDPMKKNTRDRKSPIPRKPLKNINICVVHARVHVSVVWIHTHILIGWKFSQFSGFSLTYSVVCHFSFSSFVWNLTDSDVPIIIIISSSAYYIDFATTTWQEEEGKRSTTMANSLVRYWKRKKNCERFTLNNCCVCSLSDYVIVWVTAWHTISKRIGRTHTHTQTDIESYAWSKHRSFCHQY